MLALGVGSATAIFSIVNSVLVRPLPWRDSERIMTLWELAKDGHQMHVSTLNYQDWRSQSTRLEFMTALGGSPATLAGGRAQRAVMPRFFTVTCWMCMVSTSPPDAPSQKKR